MYTCCRAHACFPGRNYQRARRLGRAGGCSAASSERGKLVGPHRWRENQIKPKPAPAIEAIVSSRGELKTSLQSAYLKAISGESSVNLPAYSKQATYSFLHHKWFNGYCRARQGKGEWRRNKPGPILPVSSNRPLDSVQNDFRLFISGRSLRRGRSA